MKTPIAISRRLPGLGPFSDYSKALYPDPPSHDFCVWLVIAELMRLYHGAPAPLKVRFLLREGMLGKIDYGPHSLMSHRACSCTVTREYSDQMLANVLRPAIEMIGAVNEPDLHAESNSVQQVCDWVEYDYHIGHLVDAGKQGLDIPRWRPPQWAFDEVDAFLKGEKPVVITLRESLRQEPRNSNLAEWVRFAEWIAGRYSILFVRDTCAADAPLPPFITCPRAATNAYVRAALYQRAFCNLMVSNGPNAWVMFSHAPYLIFKQLNVEDLPDWHHGTTEAWRHHAHMELGDQYAWASPLQRLTWTDDTFENIRAAFEQFLTTSQAITCHQQRKLVEAELLYRRILNTDPNHFHPQHLLAILKHQQNRNEEALELIHAALRNRPNSSEAVCTRGIVLGKLGRYEEALVSYDKALALRPDNPATLINRGTALHELKRDDEALRSYDKAIELNAASGDAYFNRGIALMGLNQIEEALRSFKTATAINPNDAEAHFNHGVALLGSGRAQEALRSFDDAIAIKPDDADAYFNRGNAFVRLTRAGDALASFNEAIACRHDYAEAYCNRGNVLLEVGRTVEALASFDRAIAIKPDYAEVYFNRGNAMLKLQRPKDALASCDKAIALNRNYAEAYFNRGTVLAELGRIEEALTSYDKAMLINPNDVKALCNRGNLLLELARPENAIADYDRALEINPNDAVAGSSKIFASDFIPGFGFAEHQSLQREWYCAHAKHLPVCTSHLNSPDSSRRLVVGYVSADFKHHSAMAAFASLLRHHDHARFEIICYSGVEFEDALTRELQRVADRWRPIHGLTDGVVYEQIRKDKVDILVDLAAHSAGNRLLVFARKPAPVQVTHGTGTGIPAIDYLFADPVAVPKDARRLFAEAIYDLPCLINYEAPSYAPLVSALPATSRGFVTFGCLNRFQKVSSAVLEAWAGILNVVPGSRLLLKDRTLDSPVHLARARDTLASYGVDSKRIELRGSSSHQAHLATFHEVDIALDPFPQNGGISTWEALWMGVPVVAKLGDSVPSRLSGAILCALGLNDWVAENNAAYTALAVKKAAELGALAQVRKELRSIIERSPAGNPILYTLAAEEAYKKLWQRWCDSNAVSSTAASGPIMHFAS